MSKVLISFLGIGDIDSRSYQNVTYHFVKDGGDVTNEFISLAIRERYDIDKIILIGTKGSVWENIYHYLTGKEDETFVKLQRTCSNYTLKEELDQKEPTVPSIADMDKIEEALGEESKIILITFGCNEAAQRYNAERIMDLEKYIDNKDEVYVDITHSFRSLPMYLMNCLIYIQRVKNIKISKILYGMREPGIDYVPVVELNSALDIYDWISGIDALINYGNGYVIYEKLQQSHSKKDQKYAEDIANYSDVFNVNSISDIKPEINRLKKLKVEDMESKMGQLALRSVIKECKRLDAKSEEPISSYLLELSRMQFERRNYGIAFLALKEAIIYYIVEQNDDGAMITVNENRSSNISNAIYQCTFLRGEQRCVKHPQDNWWRSGNYDNRETEWVKNTLHGKDKLIITFCKINGYRNGIAHLKQNNADFNGYRNGIAHKKQNNANFLTMINDLEDALAVVSSYLQANDL